MLSLSMGSSRLGVFLSLPVGEKKPISVRYFFSFLEFWTKDKIQNPVIPKYVRFKIFTAVTTKNAVCFDVNPCDSYKNRSVVGTYRLHH
jgi:hypothetical protein